MIFPIQVENGWDLQSGTGLNKYPMIFLFNDHLISKISFDDPLIWRVSVIQHYFQDKMIIEW